MRGIKQALQDADSALLPVFAHFWGVAADELDDDQLIVALSEALLDSGRAEQVWATLDDGQHGALQMLLSSSEKKMPTPQFERLFGEIRRMGAAAIEREKPHENPANVAEALFYRGLIAQRFEQADTGSRAVIYVADDLAHVLPVHQTAYADLAAMPMLGGDLMIAPLETVQNVQTADTSLVDDMTTLLAYLQIYGPPLGGESLAAEHRDALLPHLLKPQAERLIFLIAVGLSGGLIDIQDGSLHPKRADVRRWLAAPRGQQVQQLAAAWGASNIYRELWHIPGLHPDPGGELDQYEASVAREAAMDLLARLAPHDAWWSLDDFIEAAKATDPDFQRPGGDYSSWYIRNDAGDYLQGFESWDAVEGALLEFYIIGPMHELGLLDVADDAARLTAYGRAFLGEAAWPSRPDEETAIELEADGTLLIPRKVARIDRFQAARFSTWVAPGDPYRYRLDGPGLESAAAQGITTEHINTFLKRVSDGAQLPQQVAELLGIWQHGPTAAVTFEQVQVVRTTAPETLEFMMSTPALRRYLGARLGPMAAIMLPGEADALRAALAERGITVDVLG